MRLISKIMEIYCIADNFCNTIGVGIEQKSTFAFKSLSKHP